MLRKPLYQERALSLLEKCVDNKSLSNSLLFIGNEGVGKTSLAIYITAKLYCLEDNKPCMRCVNCLKIASFAQPSVIIIDSDNTTDKLIALSMIIKKYGINSKIMEEIVFILKDIFYRYKNNFFLNFSDKNKKKKNEIEKALENILFFLNINNDERKNECKKAIDNGILLSDDININNIPVQSIRDLLTRLYKSSFGGEKSVIITGIEKMKKEAANAFLKTLEEPPGNTKFFLCTKDESLVLPTIKSRCFKLYLNSLTDDNIKDISYTNWNIKPDHINENGSILDRIAGKNEIYINTFFKEILPSFESNVFDFIDKIISEEKFFDFMKQFSSFFTNNLDKNIITKINKIPFKTKINFINDLNKMVMFVKSNNLDKKMILEALLMKFHDIWRYLSI